MWADIQLSVVLHTFRGRTERPEDWVPAEESSPKHAKHIHDEYSEILQVGEDEGRCITDIFLIHSGDETGNPMISLAYWSNMLWHQIVFFQFPYGFMVNCSFTHCIIIINI